MDLFAKMCTREAVDFQMHLALPRLMCTKIIFWDFESFLPNFNCNFPKREMYLPPQCESILRKFAIKPGLKIVLNNKNKTVLHPVLYRSATGFSNPIGSDSDYSRLTIFSSSNVESGVRVNLKSLLNENAQKPITFLN